MPRDAPVEAVAEAAIAGTRYLPEPMTLLDGERGEAATG